MKIFKYYRDAVIYPSLFILFFSIINSILKDGLTDNSEFLTSVITSLIFCLLVSGLSLTIFLNKVKKYYNNLIWNLLTWFLLPFFYIIIIFIHDIKTRIKFEFGLGNDFLYLLIMTLPFVIGLIWTFMNYRQTIIANTA